ncbi:glycosyltransferase family 2 protein [Mumia zhuanghuii]|uniref:glycosyltransferase family 2 protein n=1 Tax=Mumia zhuanghuii TaxID=2585211 RepID=UPI001890E75C|nr:glycosyltransferase [Mumia zhuanghuii]
MALGRASWFSFRQRDEEPRRKARPGAGPQESPETSAFETSGLFDVSWYAAEADERFDDLGSAVAHYRAVGAELQLSPNPFFDPSVVDEPAPGLTPFGTYLVQRRRWRRSPHPAWNHKAYLRAHPEAADAPFGPLGHLYGSLGDESVVHLRLAGETAVPWSSVRDRWREHAVAWCRIQRTAKRGLVEELPADHVLPDHPAVVPSPETLVSIVMPTWNRSAQLLEALASVQAQTWGHWEALVVDDGSDDDTAAVVEALAERDPRIRLIRRPHEGVCRARNAALEEAQGGFVAFLDSDNRWMPDFLEAMLRAMEADGLGAAYGTMMVETPEGPRYRATQVSRDVLKVGNHVDMNVLVVRAETIRRVGGFDTSLKRAVDYDLVLRLLDVTDVVHVPVIGVLYDNGPGEDRISVREPAAWNDVVQLKHAIDWDAECAADRDDATVSVILPARDVDAHLRKRVSVARHALEDAAEVVVVDSSPSRRVASTVLPHLLVGERVTYHRLPVPVSFAYAVDVGFTLSRGASLLVLDERVLPTARAVRELAAHLESSGTHVVVQPVTVDELGIVVTAGAVFGPRHQLPAAFLGGHLGGEVRRLGPEAFPLPAVDGHTFVTRSADFARLHGLDPLLYDELEVTDFGLRLCEGVPEARQDLLPDVQVVLAEPARTRRRSSASREVFKSRHAASLTATPDAVWAACGLGVAGWERLANQPHAVRPVVYRRSSGRQLPLRWVLLTGGAAAPGWMRSWVEALSEALTAEGQDVVVHDDRYISRRLSYMDDVAVTLDVGCGLPGNPEAVRVAWVRAAPSHVRSALADHADLLVAPSTRSSDRFAQSGGPPFTTGWIFGTLDEGTVLPDVVPAGSGPVLVLGDPTFGAGLADALAEAGVEALGVGKRWASVLGDRWVRWPETCVAWYELLAGATRVVSIVDPAAGADGLVLPPVVDALVVRGEVISNVSVDGPPWAGGVVAFDNAQQLVDLLGHEPKALDEATRRHLRDQHSPREAARRLVEVVRVVRRDGSGGGLAPEGDRPVESLDLA